MAVQPIIDLALIDLKKTAVTKERILELNAQRDEFEQLDKIAYIDLENLIIVGLKKQAMDEFWTRGHIPGRPIMPGVMMIEMAAQLGSVMFHEKFQTNGTKFFGFGGVNNVKFRGAVLPGQTLVMVAKATALRSRIAIFSTQGYVDGHLVFEAEVTGLIL
ncbi:MAG: beta-hydroxyacyl-ACP dehydratase [Candidatus Margulisbacteria bacterium]|nr:beta-hydroxyacyl-ACP dehydratase [Candidatus Margulisiibacteriota bacterium]